jgi:glutamate synthase domain-containing protein 1
LLTEMLITMSDRGPDSAGIAIYGQGDNDTGKITLQSQTPEADFPGLAERITETLGIVASLAVNDTHAVLSVPAEKIHTVREALTTICPSIRVMSSGNSIEIYKEVGMPVDVANRFSLSAMTGTHGIGHTRMATESAVTTMGAHPYSTGADQCLVHNGSLSNHNSLRRKLVRAGVNIETDNDSEVAAAYLTNKMELGASLGDALENALDDLDGFYTFVVGTRDGFAVLRDPIACKPAVMAETDQYVAFGSEYRALVDLPGIDTARVWEPEPATVYFWKH